MTTFSRFALICSAYCVAQGYWLAALPVRNDFAGVGVEGHAPWIGRIAKVGPPAPKKNRMWKPESSPARQQNIPQLIVAAARRYSVDPQRALALAWSESRFQAEPKPENPCCRSVFQLHKRYFPAMPVEQHIDVAVRFFASLVKRYGDRAELVYRGGLRAIKERM